MAGATCCMVCGQKGPVDRGLMVYGFFLCGFCRAGINNISPGDTLYEAYIKGLKKIWRSRGV